MSNPRIDSTSRRHIDALETPATPAPTASPTTSRASQPSRGPSVTVDSAPRSAAQQRLAQINGRIGGANTPGAPVHNAAADFNAAVAQHRMEILSGQTPHAPVAPELPHMSGHDVFAAIGGRVTGMDAGLQRALRDARDHSAVSLVDLAINHTLGPVFERLHMDRESASSITDLVHHAVLEAGHVTAESIGAEEVAAGLEVSTTALGIIAAADALQMLGQEIYHGARNEAPPSHAVIEMIRQELPGRIARSRANLEARAGASFDAGAQQAALGRSFDPTRANDRAYMLGYQRGQQYRRENGNAYEVHDMHLRAIAQAETEAHAIMPSHVAAPERFVPLASVENHTTVPSLSSTDGLY